MDIVSWYFIIGLIWALYDVWSKSSRDAFQKLRADIAAVSPFSDGANGVIVCAGAAVIIAMSIVFWPFMLVGLVVKAFKR